MHRVDAGRTPGPVAPSAFLAACCLLAACEEHVVNYNSLLSGLPGAQQSLPYQRDIGEYRDPTRVNERDLVVDQGNNKKKLVARTGRHLMIHIYNTVDEGNTDLFVEQVLSTRTKQECAARGEPPSVLFRRLQDHQEDLQRLFATIPAGESTPGLFLRPMGGGVKRVQLDGIAAKGLYWDGFDMIMEEGSWRLVWFTGPERREK